MIRTIKGNVRIFLVFAVIGVAAAWAAPASAAEPNILSYPSTTTVFRYDPARYEVLTPGDPGYDPAWAIGNHVLWDKVETRIPTQIYGAPSLIGFEPCPNWTSEYVTLRNEFDLTVDGFHSAPRFLGNLMIRFVPEPQTAVSVIAVDGVPIDGFMYALGDLNVTTPVPNGFSDTVVRRVSWTGASSLRIVVFADRNLNGIYDDGPPLYSVRATDNVVPVEETSWGRVKALYAE